MATCISSAARFETRAEVLSILVTVSASRTNLLNYNFVPVDFCYTKEGRRLPCMDEYRLKRSPLLVALTWSGKHLLRGTSRRLIGTYRFRRQTGPHVEHIVYASNNGSHLRTAQSSFGSFGD